MIKFLFYTIAAVGLILCAMGLFACGEATWQVAGGNVVGVNRLFGIGAVEIIAGFITLIIATGIYSDAIRHNY